MKKIEIYGWGAPRPTKKNFENYLAAGFNTVLLDTWGERYGSPAVEKMFQLCDELDLDCIPFAHQDGSFFNFPLEDDGISYMQFKNYKGAFMADEPDGELLVNRLSSWVEDFERKNPGKEFRFNMSCGYPGPNTLKPEVQDSYQRVRVAYDWICDLTLDRLSGKKVFSIDYYPFQEEDGKNILQHDYLFPLEYFTFEEAEALVRNLPKV